MKDIEKKKKEAWEKYLSEYSGADYLDKIDFEHGFYSGVEAMQAEVDDIQRQNEDCWDTISQMMESLKDTLKLKQQNKKMRECLEFYASSKNWEAIIGHTKWMSNLKIEDCAFLNCGGGRARALLKELE